MGVFKTEGGFKLPLFQILTLLLAALCAILLLFSREQNIETEILKRQGEAIKKQLNQKDSLIAVSNNREKAKEAIYNALQTRYDSAVKSSTLGWKLYEHEKKHARTGILSDAGYDSAINRLYPR